MTLHDHRPSQTQGFLALCLVLLCAVVLWPCERAYASDLRTVKVGYYESRGFQEGASEDGLKSGFAYEYLQRLAGYANWDIEYVYGTWADLYQDLSEGQIDLLAGVTKSPAHADQVSFPSISMLNETFYVYEPTDVENAGGLEPGSLVGVVAGSDAERSFDEWLAGDGSYLDYQKVEFGSFSNLMEAFREGKIGGFVSADNVVHNISGVAAARLVGREPFYLAVAPGENDLLAELNSSLTLLSSQDEAFLSNLRKRFMVDTSVEVYLSPDENAWIRSHQNIVVGYLNNYLPMCSMDSAGNATGLMVDVVSAVIDALPGGWAPTVSYKSFDDQQELLGALTSGEVDAIFPVGQEAWFGEEKGFLRTSTAATASIELAKKKTVGYDDSIKKIAVNKRNNVQYSYTRTNFPDAELVEYGSTEECLAAVERGEVGATTLNGLRSSALLDGHDALEAVQMPQTDELCFGVARGNSGLFKLLNHGLGIVGEEYGTSASYRYTQGLYRYTFMDFVRDNVWSILGIIGLAAIACSVAAARHVRRLRLENLREAEQNRKLEVALDHAERAEKAKDELLTNLSHDIRTPLNAILGMMEVNSDASVGAEAAGENIQKARNASDQLLGMIDDLLEMTKLRSGGVRLLERPFDLIAIMNDALESARGVAGRAGVSVERSGNAWEEEHLWVRGSRDYVRQMYAYVLDNAIQFNNLGGKVVWHAHLRPEVRGDKSVVLLECRIEDTGIGMTPEQVDRIFEPFLQRRDVVRSVYKGSGLGMSIVKSLVDLMGGTIDVASEVGRGTQVTIKVAFERAQEPEGSEEASGALTRMPEGFDESPAGIAARRAQIAPARPVRRVMLVEDNELNLEITRCIVERQGYEVVAEARDGAQAVEVFRASQPHSIDAILMDIMMPVMDGIEATHRIRALDREDAATVRIVALTAKVFEEDRADSYEAGMNGHISKPLDPKVLLEELPQT